MSIFKKNKYPSLGVLAKNPDDPRDYQLAEIQPLSEDLPEEFNLRSQMTPIGHQNWGSCTCWAATAVAEFWNTKEYQETIDLSEKFVYINMKKISGIYSTEGDYLVNAVKSICKYGAPKAIDYPDTKDATWEQYVHSEPSPDIYTKAEAYKGKTYWTVGKTLQAIMSAIYQNKCPVTVGMPWYPSFNVTEKDGKLPLPSGQVYGGHAVSCVGWTKDKLWFKNSWGLSYGDKGYFYTPFKDYDKYELWNTTILLDAEGPKPQAKEGWVADDYLAKEFKKGDIVWPKAPLNFRSTPWGDKIDVLAIGEKLQILGESKVANDLTWQKVKRLK
jgi:C1A family cysteine protease